MDDIFRGINCSYLPDRLSVITLMYLNHDLYGTGIKYSTGFIHSIYICIGVLLLFFEDIKDKKKHFL